jgi:aspartate/methionine/tyrosine aminotransferase
MVEDINVTVAPGIDFDSKNGNSYIRISFAGSEKDLKQALSRIEKWL